MMNVDLSWSDMKTFNTDHSYAARDYYFHRGKYWIFITSPVVTARCIPDAGSADETDFVNNYKSTWIRESILRDSAGQPIHNPGIRKKNSISDGMTLVSHNFGDRSTWYQESIQVIDHIMTENTATEFQASSGKRYWVNIRSKGLTYDKDKIPDKTGVMRDFTYWDVSVKINDIETPSTHASDGWSVTDWAAGKITFDNSQTGKTIKATFYHTDGVSGRSRWVLTPPSGYKYTIEDVELQFSKATIFKDFRMEAWAGGTNHADYGGYIQAYYDAGYGQEQSIYHSVIDIVNICKQGREISAVDVLTGPTVIFPFNYTYASELNSEYATTILISIDDDEPFANCELGSITFYMEKS